MTTNVNHEKYGEISCKQSFLTGQFSVSINGTPLAQTSKRSFSLESEEGTKTAIVTGNIVTGTKLSIDGDVITLAPSAQWYEITIAVIQFVFMLVWGAVPSLAAIVPIVGGAIGGGISGVFTILNFYVMRSIKQAWLKIIVGIAIFGLNFLVCFLIGLAMLSFLI
ncbi:MAG: hypothetical protein IJX05_06210 [Clostridia bacterium]|nr:hypothetical protein [Clostridia bacterium]